MVSKVISDRHGFGANLRRSLLRFAPGALHCACVQYRAVSGGAGIGRHCGKGRRPEQARIEDRFMEPVSLARRWAGALLVLLLPASVCLAQTPAEFYKGRTIELDIGLSVGGGYDAYARMLARSMAKYIPGNPTIVPKNMEGAGSMRLANHLDNTAPKDGSAFGTINRGTVFEPLLGNKGAAFDATKFNWIGSTNNEVSVCVT